jgi:transcription initiation factor TFIIB
VIIDDTSEVVQHANDDRSDRKQRQRAGLPNIATREFIDLSSSIERSNGGKLISNLQEQVVNRAQQNVLESFAQISNYGAMMNLTRGMIEMAQRIFREAIGLSEFKSRDRVLVISASLLLACIQANADRSVKEIVKCTYADERSVSKVFTRMKSASSIRLIFESEKRGSPSRKFTKPSHFVNRFCSNLKLSGRFTSYVLKIAQELEEKNILGGKRSSTRAGACIMFAMANADPENLRSSQDIGKVCEIAESTLKSAHKVLQKKSSSFSFLVENA